MQKLIRIISILKLEIFSLNKFWGYNSKQWLAAFYFFSVKLTILSISFGIVLETKLHRIHTEPKYCTFTFDAIICSTEVSKISAVSGKVQLCLLLSACIMYEISNLSDFSASTMPRYHLAICSSNQYAIICFPNLYLVSVCPSPVSLSLSTNVSARSVYPAIPYMILQRSSTVMRLQHLALFRYDIQFSAYSVEVRFW